MKSETSLILVLETMNPLSRISSHLMKVMIVSWPGIFRFSIMDKVDMYMSISETRDNVDWLTKRIEGLAEISDNSKK